jgi:hypothetical protein
MSKGGSNTLNVQGRQILALVIRNRHKLRPGIKYESVANMRAGNADTGSYMPHVVLLYQPENKRIQAMKGNNIDDCEFERRKAVASNDEGLLNLQEITSGRCYDTRLSLKSTKQFDG